MTIWQIILLVMCIIIMFFVVVMIIDCHRLVVRRYTVKSDKISGEVNYVLLSDLHSKSFGRDNIRLINKIDELNPDAIIIAGDMYTSMKNDRGLVARKLLDNLSIKYKIYYSNGNHEQKTRLCNEEFEDTYENYCNHLKELDIIHLVNESYTDKTHNIKIYGLEIPFKYYRKFKRYSLPVDEINECVGQSSNEYLNVLIAHNPQYFESYSKWGADITFSGHVHGGLMRLPFNLGVLSPNFTFFPRYSGGEYENNGSKMILSCGLGTHHLPIRIFNPGEISYISISK